MNIKLVAIILIVCSLLLLFYILSISVLLCPIVWLKIAILEVAIPKLCCIPLLLQWLLTGCNFKRCESKFYGMTALESISFYNKKPHNVSKFWLISNRIWGGGGGGRADVLNNWILIKKFQVLENPTYIDKLNIGIIK